MTRRIPGLVLVAVLVISLNNAQKGGDGGTGETPTASNINSETGAIMVGTGESTMDTYIDFMCPICNQFETTYGDAIQGLVDDGTITLGGKVVSPRDRVSRIFYLPDGIAPWPAQTVRWALDFTIGFFGRGSVRRDDVVARLDLAQKG